MEQVLRQTSLSQQAYERIKGRIVSLDLAPGAVIDEVHLRQELALGRTPIREALQRLALEKLVVIVPRRGMYVSDIGITSLQQLFEVRLVLESLAVRYAAQRGTADHWLQMEHVLVDSSRDEAADNRDLIALDEACHQIIYEAADNEFLLHTLVTMYALSLRLWYFFLSKIGDMRGAVLEHERIMTALKAGDGEAAAQLMEKHIRTFQEEIQSVMLSAPVSP
jgi:DNA-binding GntR family transcriptional regulator